MILSEIGKYTEERLQMIHDHYSYAEIPLWVIMPNHIHLILSVDSSKLSHKKRNIPVSIVIGNCVDETFQETSLRTEHATATQSWLSVVIRQFKQSVTCFAKQNNIEFLWQTSFYDHIIRNQKEIDLISEYIEKNVRKWEEDCFYINP